MSNKDSAVGLWYYEEYLSEPGTGYFYEEMTLNSDGTGRYIVYRCMDVEPDVDMSVYNDDGSGVLTIPKIGNFSHKVLFPATRS